ncbi:hypothetical protein [Nocardia harenae]|nr:hypothetical protein [Nocardia harenae]
MIDSYPGDGMRGVHRDGRRLTEAAAGTESRTPPGHRRQRYGVQGNPAA